MSEATQTTATPAVTQESSLAAQVAAVRGTSSIWDDVKDASRTGLNLGVTIGVAVVIVSVVGAACSYLPNANRPAA